MNRTVVGGTAVVSICLLITLAYYVSSKDVRLSNAGRALSGCYELSVGTGTVSRLSEVPGNETELSVSGIVVQLVDERFPLPDTKYRTIVEKGTPTSECFGWRPTGIDTIEMRFVNGVRHCRFRLKVEGGTVLGDKYWGQDSGYSFEAQVTGRKIKC